MVDLEGNPIALFNVGGSFYAIDNTCKHAEGPLGEGELDQAQVTCPLHGWQYDVTTGACATDTSVSQKKYNVKVEGDDILMTFADGHVFVITKRPDGDFDFATRPAGQTGLA